MKYKQVQNYIKGEFTNSTTSRKLDVISPLDGNKLSEVPMSSSADLDEAVKIDGGNAMTALWRVLVPIAIPGIVTVGIYNFMICWNEFLFAVMLTRLHAKTLPVVMSGFITDKGTQWDQMTALGVITILPVLIFALSVQRYLVRGLTLGAVKE